ncbi:MAG: hypothetical protein JXR91_08785, partial [Deltaproteobacteria bacterium]|nr:hypothetical protein [Deltaproteobacteria bacterium]
IDTVSGDKKEYLDNCGNLYTINIPSNMAASGKCNFVKGKVNTSTGGTVKIHIAKPVDSTLSYAENGFIVSELFVSSLDGNGEFLMDINKCVYNPEYSDTCLVEAPLDTYKARVEIILNDERQVYKDNINLAGIETANSADTPLVLDLFWNNGLGIDIEDTKKVESTMLLKKGFNMISLMVKADIVIYASDIINAIGDKAIMAAIYDSNGGGYKSYIRLGDDVRIGTDFKVLSGISLFVKVTDDTIFKFTGKKFKKSKIIKLLKGFNLVCIPFSSKYPASKKTGMTAESILKRIGKNGLGVYKYKDGNYITYLYVGEDENGKPQFMGSKDNYDVLLGEGVFIYSAEDCSFWAE